MFNNKSLFNLMWPLLIEQTFVASLSITSTVVTSNVGEETLSAVALVESFSVFVSCLFMAVAVGATVVVAQMNGKGNIKGVKTTAAQSIILSLLVSVGLAAVIYFTAPYIFSALFGSVAPFVHSQGVTYLRASAISYPFFALYAIISGILRGKGDVKVTMLTSISMNILNLGIASFAIFVLHWGIFGTIAGMIASKVFGSLAMSARIRAVYGNIFAGKHRFKLNREVLKPVFGIGIPSGLDSLVFNGGKIIVQTFVASMGTASIVANSIGNSLFTMLNIPGIAFSLGVVTVAGQCWGAGKPKEVKKNTYKIIAISSVFSLFISVAMFIFLPQLLGIYNVSETSHDIASQLMYVALIFSPLLWGTSFVMPGALRSIGDAKFTAFVSIGSMWLSRIFFAWFLGIYLEMGVLGVWYAMIIDWVFRSIIFGIRFIKNKRFRVAKPEVLETTDSEIPQS
jgi:putative MATE family efflux protein